MLRVVLRIGFRAEHGQHLVFPVLVDGVKGEEAVFPVELVVLVVHQVAEHIAVLHVVSVDDEIGGGLVRVAALLQEQAAGGGVFFVEIPVEVVLPIPFPLHDRVIDGGVLDAEPADHVRVLGVQLFIAFQDAVGVQLIGVVLLHQLVPQAADGLFLLVGGQVVGGQVPAAVDEYADEEHQQDDAQRFFHVAPSFSLSCWTKKRFSRS